MIPIENRLSNKACLTRICIGEAILALLEQQDFSRLTVSSIVKKACVARTTFYNYYESIEYALSDYLFLMINEYLTHNRMNQGTGDFWDYEHILFSLEFFDRYRDFFIILYKRHLLHIVTDSLNHFLSQHMNPNITEDLYSLRWYSGGLLNVFITWELSDKKEDVRKVADTLYRFFHHA